MWEELSVTCAQASARARVHDLVFERRRGNRRTHAEGAGDAYLSTAGQVQELDFGVVESLVRAWHLSRSAGLWELHQRIEAKMIQVAMDKLRSEPTSPDLVLPLLQAAAAAPPYMQPAEYAERMRPSGIGGDRSPWEQRDVGSARTRGSKPASTSFAHTNSAELRKPVGSPGLRPTSLRLRPSRGLWVGGGPELWTLCPPFHESDPVSRLRRLGGSDEPPRSSRTCPDHELAGTPLRSVPLSRERPNRSGPEGCGCRRRQHAQGSSRAARASGPSA